MLFSLAALRAQAPVDAFAEPWRPVAEYLGLSNAQVVAIRWGSNAYWRLQAELEERRERLRAEVLKETGQSPLQPAELGRLHGELEMNRREMRQRESERIEAARNELTPEQRRKLQTLEELTALRTQVDTGRSLGLLPTDCAANQGGWTPSVCERPLIPAVTEIPTWGPREGDRDGGTGELSHYARLVRFLGLTNEQQSQIVKNRQLVYGGAEIERMSTVAGEIAEETERPVLDTMALGLRYAEMEAIRRKTSEDMRRLNAMNLAVLTAAQRTKYEALEEAMRLRATVEEARSVELLGSRCEQRIYLLLNIELSKPAVFGAYFGDCPDRRALEELP